MLDSMTDSMTIVAAIIMQCLAIWVLVKNSQAQRSKLRWLIAIIATVLSFLFFSLIYGILAGAVIAISMLSLLGIAFSLLSNFLSA